MNTPQQLNALSVNFLKRVYYATPFLSIRQLYFQLFARLMRGRIVRADVEGVAFELDLSELIDLQLYLNQWERDVTALIDGNCRSGMTVLDIGANVGAHALRFAKIVGATGKVFAFEPTDYAYRKLVRNLSLNPFPYATPIQVALADHTRQRQMIDFRSSWRTDDSRADGATTVDFETLDNWCSANSVANVDLIKIDVDGNEFPILLGGQNLLNRCHPVILMEAVSPHFEHDETNPFLYLERLQYRFWNSKTKQEYPGFKGIQSVLPKNDPGMTTSLNLIASIAPPNLR